MTHRTLLKDVARYAAIGFAGLLLVAAPVAWLPAAGATDLVVNGRNLSEAEANHVRWIADKTYDRLTGSRVERLDTLATVTWWSLKEGVLDLENPHAYNNCLDGGKDTRYGPAQVCGHQIWQVGIAGIQVNNFSTEEAEQTIRELYPGSDVDSVLRHTLRYSGFGDQSETSQTVMNGSDLLRRSWLLRNHGVAFGLQRDVVRRECVDGAESWCYGTAWETSQWYAPSRDAAMGAIDDLREIMATLTADGAEQPAEPGGEGVRAEVWDTGGVGLHVRAEPNTDAEVLHKLHSGDPVTISCQVEGPEVHNDVAGVTSNLWDYLPKYDGYVADAWVYTGTNGRVDGAGDCRDGGNDGASDGDGGDRPPAGDTTGCDDGPAFPDGRSAAGVVAAMEQRWSFDFQGSRWTDEAYRPLLKVWWNTLAKVECTPFLRAVNHKNGGSLPIVSVNHPNGIWGWYKGHPDGLHIDLNRQLGGVNNGIFDTVQQNIIHELGHAYNNDRYNSPTPAYWQEYRHLYLADGGLSGYGRSSDTENFADVLGFYVSRCAEERFEVDSSRPNPYDSGYSRYYELAKEHVFGGVEFGPRPGAAANC